MTAVFDDIYWKCMTKKMELRKRARKNNAEKEKGQARRKKKEGGHVTKMVLDMIQDTASMQAELDNYVLDSST